MMNDAQNTKENILYSSFIIYHSSFYATTALALPTVITVPSVF